MTLPQVYLRVERERELMHSIWAHVKACSLAAAVTATPLLGNGLWQELPCNLLNALHTEFVCLRQQPAGHYVVGPALHATSPCIAGHRSLSCPGDLVLPCPPRVLAPSLVQSTAVPGA